MNQTIWLNILLTPTLISSVLVATWLTGRASAATSTLNSDLNSEASCDVLPRSSQPSTAVSSIFHTEYERLVASAIAIPVEYPELDFTTAESDAAVTLFGCDCPACIGALRQLRNQSLDAGQGHCWTVLQQRVSPEEVQEVLQNLDAAEGRI
jgi:hypothetical protein